MHRLSRTWPFHLLVGCACLVVLTFAGCGGNGKDEKKSEEKESTKTTDNRNETAAAFRFTDITASTGVEFTYLNGDQAGHAAIPETLGGGVAAFDFDLDGWVDLFFAGGGFYADNLETTGQPSSVWHNRENAKFDDRTEILGIETTDNYGFGALAADVNSDGFADLILGGLYGIRLFVNMGDGTFAKVEDSGLPQDRWCPTLATADFNGDGILDMYVMSYVKWGPKLHKTCAGPEPGLKEICGPKDFVASEDRLFLGTGDGTFVEEPVKIGDVQGGKGLGVMAGDFDLDGDADVYVANDTTPNFFLRNDGPEGFVEVGQLLGVAVDHNGIANGSMGVAVADYDLDLIPDICVANYDNESFAVYRQTDGGVFLPKSEASGMTAVGENFVSWGTVATDVDSDGDEDLIVTNGHIEKYPDRGERDQLVLVMCNMGGRFERVKFSGEDYLARLHHGRGLALADLDRDGDDDLVFANVNEPAAILANETEPIGDRVRVRLIGTGVHRDAVGARAILQTSEGKQLRLLVSGGSYLSQSQPELVFGVPEGATVESLDVTWPDGSLESFAIQANDPVILIQGESEPYAMNFGK